MTWDCVLNQTDLCSDLLESFFYLCIFIPQEKGKKIRSKACDIGLF